MPRLIRLYFQSVLLGFLLSAGFTFGFLWWDVAGLGNLIQGSDIGWIAVVMLVVFNGIVFSAVQFAFRIMGMAQEEQGPTGGHRAMAPARLPVKR